MTIFSSLNVGVSGMQAQSNALGIISDNIANSSTTGYKEGTAAFATLIAFSSAADYNPGGVMGGNEQLNSLQGSITPTSSATDLAITGNGFFPVTSTATVAPSSVQFTRAGSFTADKNGNLINGAGYYLQGWSYDTSGNLPSSVTASNLASATAIANLTPVNIQIASTQPVATTSASLEANLDATAPAYHPGPPYNATSNTANMASGSIPPASTQTVSLTDSMSVTHNLTLGYLKTGANSWAVEVYANPASDVTSPGGQLAYGTLTLNANGTLASVSPSLTSISVPWTDGATASTLAQDWAASAQTLNAGQAIYNPPVQYNAASNSANMASGSVAAQFTQPLSVVDSLGAAHNFNIGYLKTATNSWAVEIYAQPAADVTASNGQVAAGTLTFNSDGTLASVSPSLSTIPITWTNGASASSVAVNWGTAGALFGTPSATVIGRADGLSQFGSGGFNITSTTQNGISPSTLKGIAIASDGTVTATYNDGNSRNLYKIPLVDFVDPNQLQSINNNIFEESSTTGTANFLQAGTNGSGTMQANALEASNVDLSGQLTNLIVAQRAYQANSKTISTTDSMLQQLDQLLT